LQLQLTRYDLPREVSALEAYACGDDATLCGKFKWKTTSSDQAVIAFDFGKYKGMVTHTSMVDPAILWAARHASQPLHPYQAWAALLSVIECMM